MTKEEYLALCQKYQEGTCTLQEKKLVEEYQDQFELQELPWDVKAMGQQEEVKQAILHRLEEARNLPRPIHQPLHYSIPYTIAAAVALILISVASYFWLQKKSLEENFTASALPNIPEEVLPGRDKAYLTLADGTFVDLEEVSNGNLSKIDEIKIMKLDGRITYSGKAAIDTQYQTHSLTTPNGGQYQITLSDGTHVWLNAASSLRFPEAFTGKERVVELEGEGYFEVAKNTSMPFKVRSKGMEIEVVGTHFNLMAYPDDKKHIATLLEGAVKVRHENDVVLLRPNQEAMLQSTTSNLQVNFVDAQESIAWKNGQFLFQEEDIRSVMRKISRWYNVEIVYEGTIGKKDFTGTISRFEDISDVLEMLELTEAVHFKKEGRRLIVMP